jgi:type VI secretion system protein ImpJ
VSLDSKVVWAEGMFLSAQHFQQQERYIERYVDGRCVAHGAYGWGMQDFEIDQQLLKLGKISVIHARGVFPDGTPFSFPDTDDVPPVFEVPENTHDQVLYLALPVKRPGAVEVLSEQNPQGLARYYSSQVGVRDVTSDEGDNATLNVGKLRIRLLLESDDLSGYACIGLARIAESRQDKNVLLDDRYIPTCLDCDAAPRLSGFLSELVGLLHHRAEAVAGRLADTHRGGTAEIADYMMLQFLNRAEPLVEHFSRVRGLHPVDLFAQAVQMAGELSTFVTKNKRPAPFPPYLHDNLQDTFLPVMARLRECLSMVYEQTAVSMPLVEKKYGIRVTEISDRSLVGTAMFVLAVRASVTEDVVRSRFPAQAKIGPVERIRQLVNAAMSGITLKPLPVAPRQIPFHAGYTYFELDRTSPFWKELKNSGGFAIHVGGDFPGLEMEFWAIRQ